jgi:hypothetical protein
LAGTVTSRGNHNYQGAVWIGNATGTGVTVNLTSSGSIYFRSSLDDAGSAGSNSLALTADPGLSGANNFDGLVGASSALNAITVHGLANLGADLSTTGDQTYHDPVYLYTNATVGSQVTLNTVTLSATNLTFNGALNAGWAMSGLVSLVSNASGLTSFVGLVGSQYIPKNISVSNATKISRGIISTGNQTYGRAVTIDGAVSITSGGAVGFDSTLDNLGSAHNLTIAAVGALTLSGAIGSSTVALGAINLTSNTSTISFLGAVDNASSVTVSANGAITFGANVGALSSVGAINLTSSTSTVSFLGALDRASGITVLANGAITFGANVGALSSVGAINLTSSTSTVSI